MKTIPSKILPPYIKRLTKKRTAFTTVMAGPWHEHLDTSWGGGSRNEYWAVNGKETAPIQGQSNPFAVRQADYQFDDKIGLVRGGTFCGKPATLSLKVTTTMAVRMAGFTGIFDLDNNIPVEWVRDWLKDRDYESGLRFEELFVP